MGSVEKIPNTKYDDVDLCIVISDLGAGGAQRVLINLLHLWQYQYRIVLITLADGSKDFFHLPESIKRFSIGGIKKSSNYIVALIANIKRIFLLRRAIGCINSKVVLSFISPTNILTILASRGLKTRIVISERNDAHLQSFGWIWDRLRYYCYRYADRVTANSHGALESMQSYVPRHKLYWVPNPLLP